MHKLIQSLAQTIYSFDAAAIHSCNTNPPINYDYKKFSDKCLLPIKFKGFPLQCRLDDFPVEVLAKIANQLLQHDCLSIMYTCKLLYNVGIAHLYQSVIIDKSYSRFNHEKHAQIFSHPNRSALGSTYIRTFSNFIAFLKHVSEAPYLRSLIKRFRCITLPDNTFPLMFPIRHVVKSSLQSFFAQLPTLNELVWLDVSSGAPEIIKFTSLMNVENKLSLQSIAVDLSMWDITAKSGIQHQNPVCNFLNLRNLALFPISNSQYLAKLVKIFVSGTMEGEIYVNRRLKSLGVARLPRENKILKPPSSLLILTSPAVTTLDLDVVHSLSSVQVNGKKLNIRYSELNHLSLSHCFLVPGDFPRLNLIVNLRNLTRLEFIRISEVQIIPHGRIGHGTKALLAPSLIVQLAPLLLNLEVLHLDYRECMADTVPEFLSLLTSPKLRELDITVRWNQSKLSSYSSWQDLCALYLERISLFKGSLTKLSISAKEENLFGDLGKQFPEGLLETFLPRLQNLVSLRVDSEKRLPADVERTLSVLPNLQFLDLQGSGSDGAPHMAFQVVHSGILDSWLKVEPLVLKYLKASRAHADSKLRYVRLGGSLFEVEKGGIRPREGIDAWFNEQVRVGDNF
ncbi:hypothetical protein BABINDRAFT_163770 [Babjeviella inositovora NRRL Y-12698]|uniref:F-box domain-containing protein n=1 Tax=Babjeviella inositovora NRRL Y-12698 TaxID=984486 RepID=A0A1E3QHF9_9ASCO|nr:uncharacterized protein BABINDRAFT_163770 [Babjeviella inositovora NRRL Y-12698]ODQ77038.1 hypothetical protein BABINDRAFT_163770 [Babjeviella inositovora NRRL Y-12698]